MIMTTNFHKTAILVKSPFNDGSGIWFSNKWTKQNSNWNNYFSVSIVSNQFYRLYKYKGYQLCEIKEVRGSLIISAYEKLKLQNSQKFKAMPQAKQNSIFTQLWNLDENETEEIVWD